MLMIRLQRLGKSKHASYRVIVSEKQKDPQAGHLEILGRYCPTLNPKVVDIKKERVQYWLSVGAKPSPTVCNLLIGLGVLTGKKQRAVHISHSRKVKNEKKAAVATAAAAKSAAKSA